MVESMKVAPDRSKITFRPSAKILSSTPRRSWRVARSCSPSTARIETDEPSACVTKRDCRIHSPFLRGGQGLTSTTTGCAAVAPHHSTRQRSEVGSGGTVVLAFKSDKPDDAPDKPDGCAQVLGRNPWTIHQAGLLLSTGKASGLTQAGWMVWRACVLVKWSFGGR